MQCCAAVRATYRKQQTPQHFEWRGQRRGVDIVLSSEVTLFEYKVSTILSPIVANIFKRRAWWEELSRQRFSPKNRLSISFWSKNKDRNNLKALFSKEMFRLCQDIAVLEILKKIQIATTTKLSET